MCVGTCTGCWFSGYSGEVGIMRYGVKWVLCRNVGGCHSRG